MCDDHSQLPEYCINHPSGAYLQYESLHFLDGHASKTRIQVFQETLILDGAGP
jgi:hypothetical protein